VTRPRPRASERADLAGQVALVTGGARGIGEACALALAREDADVAVADLLPTDSVVAALDKHGRRAVGLV
jgi:NAD(P)-dependent dehydrogenase (short-subunit alcohol dehydrogenase family)